MTDNNNSEDNAWASVVVPLSRQDTLTIVQDPLRLLRMNPMLYYSKLEQAGDNTYVLAARNTSQEPDFEIETGFTAELLEDGVKLVYGSGLKSSTLVSVEEDEQGAKITITEDYSGSSKADREQRLGEVDKSLVAWARAIQEYAMGWNKWSWCAPWRWYMRRIWHGMNPSARRISYMLIWVTFAEIVAFLMIFIIFWFEYDKYFGN